MNTHSIKIIEVFARHKVAANIFMLLMILLGIFALSRLNIQFFPDFELEVVTVSVKWQGASAEDIESSIVKPIEQELRGINFLKDMYSSSKEGIGLIYIEFMPNTDMSEAMDDVKDRIALVRNLPDNSEEPEIVRNIYFEEIAKLIITSDTDLRPLRSYIYKFEQELLNKGISKIKISGLPDEEISIEIPIKTIPQIKKSLVDIGQQINKHSQNIPAGKINKNISGQQIRVTSQRRSAKEFAEIPLYTDNSGRLLRVQDIATVTQKPIEDESLIYYEDKPAVVMTLLRSKNTDSLDAANIYTSWLKETKNKLPSSIQIKVFDERWQLIKQRIMLLLKNGLGGLILLVAIMFLFLNKHLAAWTTVGIPVSFLATIGILYFLGGSINMISLFGLIMALGIIVDDAIVVGEQSLSNFESGMSAEKSVISGANRMIAPVMASSLTTIAAFIPLLNVQGLMGTFLQELPIVVICVIIASLIECFFVLPGHLYHSFTKIKNNDTSKFRQKFDEKFNYFKYHVFKPYLNLIINKPKLTLVTAIGILIISFSFIFLGYIKFTFFPSPESTRITVNIQFSAGMPSKAIYDFINTLKQSATKTEKELNTKIIKHIVLQQNVAQFVEGQNQTGTNFATIFVETVSPENRNILNNEFIEKWQKNTIYPTGIENINFMTMKAGPPGGDIDILFTNQPVATLKQASNELIKHLKTITGVYNIKDDIPYGQKQKIFTISPRGQALGLTPKDIADQIRAAFDGYLVQIFNQDHDEIEVKVILPDQERNKSSILEELPIVTPTKKVVPLSNVVTWSSTQGIDIIKHHNANLAINITADVNTKINNTNNILDNLKQNILLDIKNKYNIEYNIKGRSEDEVKTLANMKQGALIAIILIYLILCWVFSSYLMPLIVLLIIPFGIAGAIIGHFIMGLDLTLLSIFGMFGLSGIIINDGIILVLFYNQIKSDFNNPNKAIIEASCQRLRPVILTSMTTIAGICPLLFETSTQAQFLIPMVTSITFGLAFGTVLILILIPTIIILYENINIKIMTNKINNQMENN